MSNLLANATGLATVRDTDLVVAFRAKHDPGAFGELVRRHQIPVFRLLTGLLADPDAAEAACERVFVRAAHRIDELPKLQPFESWLLTLARELAEEPQKSSVIGLRPPPLPSGVALDEKQISQALRRAVREVLASLPPDQRVVLVMAELQGHSVEHISETLERSVEDVRGDLASARREFMAALARPEPGGSRPDQPTKAVNVGITAVFTAPHAVVQGYEVDQLIGAGAMGEVFKAVSIRTGQDVALKVLLPERASMPGPRERFRREAAAMRAVVHPNAVSFLEKGQTQDGGEYLAMEFVQGVDLRRRLSVGSLSTTLALSIVKQVALALAAIHAADIVHRDIKPSNILISEERGNLVAKIADFGVAQIPLSLVAQSTSNRLTAAGGAIGTPAYIAPEQASGQPVDGRADLYSLSVMLFELLTKRLPFEASKAGTMLAMHLTVPPPKVSELAPNLPAVELLDALMLKGLAKRAESRFADARKMAEAIERALAEVDTGVGN